MANLQIGDQAPDFTLQTAGGDPVSLATALQSGPVVLIFYPMDSTPGCKAQLCAVRDDAAQYQSAGVSVYGVNNGSAASHDKFSHANGFTAPLLVDKDLGVAGAYSAVTGFGRLRMIKRTVVGIGQDGRVAFYKRGSPSTSDILAGVAAPTS
jgi:thioredoxin-dependent peroxiredoxin